MHGEPQRRGSVPGILVGSCEIEVFDAEHPPSEGERRTCHEGHDAVLAARDGDVKLTEPPEDREHLAREFVFSRLVEALLLLLGAISANMPGDTARVQRGFDFVRSYLKTDVAPAEGCPDLPL